MNDSLPITLIQPHRLEVGSGAAARVGGLVSQTEKVLIVANRRTSAQVGKLGLKAEVTVFSDISSEPDIAVLDAALTSARLVRPDVVIGFGGGSVLDVAKLVAALWNSAQSLREVVGSNKVEGRSSRLFQIATTAGSGSEAGSRALIIDSAAKGKLAVESPHLLADVAILDPELTFAVPPKTTAATGLDALAHCVEAYTSRKAHPVIDCYARMGIDLIGKYLARAVANGHDAEARQGLLMASFYGGICLGPVNTAAGHAVAYPLGTHLNLPHGLANAIIFPHVLSFNETAARAQTADIVNLLGLEKRVATDGLLKGTRGFCEDLGIEMRLSRHGATVVQLSELAAMAHSIRRLMDNNPRDMSVKQIEAIYRSAL